jgi:hypothetical protein
MRQRIQQISIDHSITLALILFVVILFSAFQLTAQEKTEKNKIETPAKIENQNSPQVNGDKIEFKNENNAAIITITDEGSNKGSITLPEMSTTPAATTDKLYNLNGILNFGGTTLGSGGANQIDDLTDAKYDGSSLFLGINAGMNDDGDNANTAVGIGALLGNSTGINNTAYGNAALSYSVGNNNVGIGYQANYFNKNGSNNTILGYQAGRGTTLHANSGSVFLGYQAGYNELSDNKLYIENSSSSTPLIWGDFTNDSVKINGDFHVTGNITSDGTIPGASAINDLTDGKTDAFSLFLGNGAGVNDDGGISDGIQNYNTGIGFSALSINTGGNYNTAVGYLALYESNNCDLNTAIGFNTLYQNGKNITEYGQGFFNTAIGGNVLSSNTTGTSNTGVGSSALQFNISGNYNTAIGSSSSFKNTLGSRNTTIGYQAGFDISSSSPSGNVFIGYKAGFYETNDNKLYIENSNSSNPLIWGDFTDGSEKIKINGSFEVTSNFKLPTGASNGYVLTSDAAGNATWQSNTNSLSIGDNYQGGIIFWLDESGQHGLIAAATNQSVGTVWSSNSTSITSANGDGIGAGEMNSLLIVSENRSGTTAAKLCTDLIVTDAGKKYGDWYLPSHDELKLMYAQKTAIGGFLNTSYWSSTEFTFEFVKVVDFGTGSSGASFYKSTATVCVRAIRNF